MSGIAEVLNNLGYTISGSDNTKSSNTQRLEKLGIQIVYKHSESNLDGIDMVVKSTAIADDNPEIIEAKQRLIPILARAEMLSSLMNNKRGIAIAGTHGKTTTTSLVASIMSNAGLDPTFINGGIINSFNSNAQLGKGDYLIAEADESDQSFLLLQPSVSVITNIEPDHLVNYENSFPNLKNAFLQFIKNLPFNGVSIVCGDDEVIKDLKINFQRPHISYGFEMDNDFVLSDYESSGTQSYFKMTSDSGSVDLNLNMLGKHNALNAAAATILCLQEGISIEVIQESLIGFMGIDRRMQILGEHTVNDHSCIYFDDYGHHPTEIEKTIEAIKDSYPDRKIVMVFQPHRFSRTKDLFHEFVQVLRQVDQLLLLDIYPAGEKAVDGIDSANLKKSLIDTGFDAVELVKDNQRVMNKIDKNIHSDTVFVFQGAGDISAISRKIKSNFFPDGQ
jgi:UDP-N-acetylmuramate--alanine ligase